MQIPKQMILDLLEEQGRGDQAGAADRDLPGNVDTDQHAGLLQQFGLDPQDVVKLLGSRIPGL